MRLAVAVLICAALALSVTASSVSKKWQQRQTDAQHTRRCVDPDDDPKWLDRPGYVRCATCESRCYHSRFNATASTSGAPALLCDTAGDECQIDVWMMTAPCCRCEGTTEITDALQEDGDDTFQMDITSSRCEVEQIRVLVNGYWVLPLDGACDPYAEPLFSQTSLMDDNTQNIINDCFGGGFSGSAISQVYNQAFDSGRYPHPCFQAKHWRTSFVSAEEGLLTSTFNMWRPGNDSFWFQHDFAKTEALSEVPCNKMPEQWVVYVPPV